jgi:hypothetical protein
MTNYSFSKQRISETTVFVVLFVPLYNIIISYFRQEVLIWCSENQEQLQYEKKEGDRGYTFKYQFNFRVHGLKNKFN